MDDSLKSWLDIGIKAAGLIGLWFTFFQLRTSRRSLLFSTYKDAMALLDDKEVRQARQWLRKQKNLADLITTEKWDEILEEPTKPDDSDKQAIKEFREKSERWRHKQMAEITMRHFDRIGLLVREGKIPLDLIARFYVTPILRSWENLTPYIESVRTDKKQRGHMWEFENLVFGIIIPGLKSDRRLWKGLLNHEGLRREDLDRLPRPATRDDAYSPPQHPWYSCSEDFLESYRDSG